MAEDRRFLIFLILKETQKMPNYYPKLVAWSKKENCWIGHCPVVDQKFQCKGDDEIKVFKKLSKILDRHLEQPEPKEHCIETFWKEKLD